MHKDDLDEIFSRGVAGFIDPDGKFREKLEKKQKGEYSKDIIVKLGADPNRPDIHLGHAVVLRKLRQLQDLGCKIVFIVGDYTARIGDPTGKSKTRPEIEQAEVEKNASTFIEQIGKILRTDDSNLFSWIRNSDWFINVTDLNLPDDYQVSFDVTMDGKTVKAPIHPNSIMGKAAAYENTRMQKEINGKIFSITLHTFLWTLKHITHARLIERDMFQERIKAGEELSMQEMMYPVLQGIDSVALNNIYGACDLEIGGSDQAFNMLVGRDILKLNSKEPQAVMYCDILPGLDGSEKMSKSLDNYIAVTDTPNDMFGKVMSIPDNCLEIYYKLATYTPQSEIEEIMKKVEVGEINPRDAKMKLARQIVAIYHGDDAAEKAENNFIETFSKGGVPEDIEVVKAAAGTKLGELLVSQAIVESKSEWRRLVESGAVKNMESGENIGSPDAEVENMTVKVGKRRFVRVELL